MAVAHHRAAEHMNTQSMSLCPFCGGTPKVVTVNDSSWWVECRACEVETRSVFSEGDAVSQWNRRDVVVPATFAALARLGARLCRDQLSPTGGFCHAPYAVLDRMGVEEGVLIVGYPDATGPVMKDGIRKAIADILGPVGGYIMGGNEEL